VNFLNPTLICRTSIVMVARLLQAFGSKLLHARCKSGSLTHGGIASGIGENHRGKNIGVSLKRLDGSYSYFVADPGCYRWATSKR
jgi:hypothetical protein